MAITEKQERELRGAISRALSAQREFGRLFGRDEAFREANFSHDILEPEPSLYEAAAKADAAQNELMMQVYSVLDNI